MSRLSLNACRTVAALALVATAPAWAQWSSDPSTNLVIADAVGAQNNPHVVPTTDGGFYVSWYGASSTGFDVRLQRLDAEGHEMWAHDGVLVADRDFSSVQDYGLAVDSSGNARLVYRKKDGSGVPQIEMSTVDGSGNVTLQTALTSYAGPQGADSPRIAAASFGNFTFVAWHAPEAGDPDSGSILMQKYSAYGGTIGAQIKVAPPSGANLIADLQWVSNGGTGVILSWSAQLGQYDRELWAQKFDFGGTPQWGDDGNGNPAPVKVYDGSDGEAMQYGYFPHFVLDGSGGAVFAWYAVGLNAASARVQHLDATGAPAFAQNGVKLSTDTSRLHGPPAAAFDAASGSIYALWPDADAGSQSQFTLYAQKVDASGAVQWGSEGKVLVPTSGTQVVQPVALTADNGDLLAAWVTGTYPAPMPVHASRLAAADGSAVWAQPVIDIATGARTTARLQGVQSSNGFAAYVWRSGSASDDGDIVAQNLSQGGVPGNDTIFKNGFDGD